ncbi:lipopolysaccharide biosynthesis protein [Breznakia pachnodae]|uniref:O-antigen/teichoic acid export membrane protein n=1 Tax=Breznakia pachnodae TaxID=265178 RepID=A0ABU0DYS3_9FIRM|nr:lipopolysaccharide biosynthesis protein [Breznakia pachnodae]MDQ0359782.1 O-antigen/teichoic acid export membrane protein [Breznakia pachnodae]
MENNKKLSLSRNLLWNSIGSFVYLACQWAISSFLVLRITNDESIAGILTLAITITNIFYNVSCFNVRPYLISDMKSKYKDDEYISFRAFTCILGYVLCFVYIMFFAYSFNEVLCIMLYMLYKIGEAIVDIMHAFEQRESRMDIGGRSLLLRGIVSLLSFYFALKFTGNISLSVLIMAIFSFICILIYDVPNVKNFVHIKFSSSLASMKLMFIEFLPLTIASFLSTFSASFPRQMLDLLEGNAVLAVYGYVAAPTVIVQVAASYIFNPFLTIFADYLNKNDIAGFKKMVNKIILVLIGISVICIIGGQLLGTFGLRILYGERIANYSYLLVPIILYTSLTAFVWFLWNLLIILRCLKQLLIINIIGLVVVLCGSYFVIQQYSMDGVTYVLLIYVAIVLAMMLLLLRNKLRQFEENNKMENIDN